MLSLRLFSLIAPPGLIVFPSSHILLNQRWIDPNVDLSLSIPNSVMEMPKEISEACQGNRQSLELIRNCIVLRDIGITFACSF